MDAVQQVTALLPNWGSTIASPRYVRENNLWTSVGALPPVLPSAIRQHCCAASQDEACMMRRCWPRGMYDAMTKSFSIT